MGIGAPAAVALTYFPSRRLVELILERNEPDTVLGGTITFCA